MKQHQIKQRLLLPACTGVPRYFRAERLHGEAELKDALMEEEVEGRRRVEKRVDG